VKDERVAGYLVSRNDLAENDIVIACFVGVSNPATELSCGAFK
jgi:hypothetical protein